MSERSLDRKLIREEPTAQELAAGSSASAYGASMAAAAASVGATATVRECDNENGDEEEADAGGGERGAEPAPMSSHKSERRRKEALWDLFQSECAFLNDHLMVLKNVSICMPSKIDLFIIEIICVTIIGAAHKWHHTGWDAVV